MLTDEYGINQQITDLVNSREIWMVFDMNPDGGEYDIATGGTARGARIASLTPAHPPSARI